jgi:tRNA A37 N6-isopentenylltransferase MiaA
VGKGHLLTTTGLLPVAAIKEAAELRAVSFCRFAQRQRAWVRAQAQEWAP